MSGHYSDLSGRGSRPDEHNLPYGSSSRSSYPYVPSYHSHPSSSSYLGTQTAPASYAPWLARPTSSSRTTSTDTAAVEPALPPTPYTGSRPTSLPSREQVHHYLVSRRKIPQGLQTAWKIDGVPMDAYALFAAVLRAGGSGEVTKRSAWPSVAEDLGFRLSNEYPGPPEMLQRFFMKTLKELEDMWEETKRVQAADDAAGSTSTGFSHRSHAQRDGPMDYTIRDMAPRGGSGSSAAAAAPEQGSARQRQESVRHNYTTGQPSTNSSGWSSAPISPDTLPATLGSYASASTTQSNSGRLTHTAPTYPSSASVPNRLHTQGNKSISPMLPPVSALDFADRTSSYAAQTSGQSARGNDTFSSLYPPDLHVNRQPDTQWSRASASSSYDQFSYTPDMTPPQTSLPNPQALSAQASTSQPAVAMHTDSARNGEQADVPAAPPKKPRKPRQPKPPADPNAPPKKRGRPRKTAAAPEAPSGNQAHLSTTTLQDDQSRLVGQAAVLSHDQPSTSLSAGQRNSDNLPMTNSTSSAAAPAPTARLPTSINPAALHLAPQTQASTSNRPEAPRPAGQGSQQRPAAPTSAQSQGAPSRSGPPTAQSASKSVRPAQTTSNQPSSTSVRAPVSLGRPAAANMLSPFSGPAPTAGGLASVIHEAIRSEISSYTAPKVNDFRHLVDSNVLPLPKSSSSETPSGDKVYQYSKRCHEILGAVKASAKQAPGVKVSLDELIFWSKLLAILKANPKVTIPGLPDQPPSAIPNSTNRQTAVGPSNAASTTSTSVAPAGPSSQPANTIAAPLPASEAATSATPAKKRQRKSNQDYLRDTDGNPILDEDGHMIFIPKLPKPRASFVLDENGNPVLGEDGEPIRKKLGRPPKYYKYVCGPDGLPLRDQYGETYLLKRVFHLPDGSVALNNKGQPIRKKKGPQPVPVFDGNGKIILDQKGFVFHRPFESFLPKLDEEGHVVRDAKGCPVAANKRPEVDWSFHTIDTSANQPPPKRARFASQNPIFIDDELDPWEPPATLAAAMESQPAGPSTARLGRPGPSRAEVVLDVARPRWDRISAAQGSTTSPGPRPHGRTGASRPTPLTSTTSPLHSLFGSATPKRTINLSGSQSTPQQTPSTASKRKDKGKGRASGSTLVAEQLSTPVTRGRKSDPSPATVPRVTRSTAVPEITPVPAKSAKRARSDSSPRALRSMPSVAHALLTRSSSRSLPRVLRRLSAPARPIAPLPTHKPRTPTSRSANSSPLASRRVVASSGPSRLRTSITRPTRVKIERVSSTESSPRPARQRMVPFIELQSPRKQVKTEAESLSDSASEPSGPIDRARVVLTIGRKKRAKLIQQGFYDAFRDDDSDAETYIRRPGGLRAIKVPLPKSDASRWARPMDPEPVPQRFLVRPGTTMIEPWRTILDPTTILKRAHQLECGWKGCDATLASEWLLARHVEVQNHASRGEFHGGMYGETTLWRCHWKDCDNPCFRSLSDLKQHMTARHISRVLYCPFPDCGLSSPNISHLSRHVMKTHDLPSDIPVPLADLSRPPPRDSEPLAELPGELRVDELATPLVPGTTYRTAHRIEWCRQKVQHGSMAGPDPIIHFEHPPRMLDVVENDMDAPPSDSDDASSADSDDELFTDDPRALDRALGRKRHWELVVLILPTKRSRPDASRASMPDIIEVLDSSPEPEPEPVLDGIEPASASPAPANDPVESVITPEDATVALSSSHAPIQAALVEAMQGDVDTALMAAAEDIGQSLENTAEDEIDMGEWDDSAFDQDVTLDSAIFEEELSINDMTTRDPSVYDAEAGEDEDDELDDTDNDHAIGPDVLRTEEDGSEQSGQQAMLDALDALDTETPADGTPPNVPPAVDVELAQPNQPLSAAQADVDVDMEEPGTPVDFSTPAVGDTSVPPDEALVGSSEFEQVGEASSNDATDKLDEDDLDDLPELEEVPPTPWPM